MINEEYKIVNGKRMTCGIIIANKDNDILAGHPTGRGYHAQCYDLLKGCANKDEDDFACAARELKEESGINIFKKCHLKKIKDLGIFQYNKEKYIHLYLVRFTKFPNTKKLHCDSYFYNDRGEKIPEMNGYRVIKKNERHLFYKGIQFVLKKIDELN